MNTFQQAKKGAKSLTKTTVKSTRRAIADEIEEFAKSAKKVTGSETAQSKPQGTNSTNAVHSVNKITDAEKQSILIQERQKLSELESELKQLRKERKEREERWRYEQELKMKKSLDDQEEKPLIEPTTKRKKGFMGVTSKIKSVVKRKQGTKELGKKPTG